MRASLTFVTDHFRQATRTLATGTGPIAVRLDQAAQKIRPVLPADLPDGDLRDRYEHFRERLTITGAPKWPECEAAALAGSLCDLTSDLVEMANDW
jgi:hypothetical protein